jgi:membrane-associated protease RseP (regulator of RpoE activity)
VQEFGHYVVARRRGITVSLPYFIPAPVYLGTFGAFIQMRGTLRDRASYFDVAIAGPLAGLVVALLALAVGLGAPASAPHGGLVPASSALFAGIYKLVGGGALDQQIVLGPLAFAGYLGLVVTALNLAPIGQLDGGHVAYALLGQQRAARLASAVIMLLLLAGLFYSRHYLMWALIAWFVAGSRHPRALDETVPIGAGRMLLGLFALGLLLAIVLPWPASGRP